MNKYKDTLVTKVTLVKGMDVTEMTEQDFLSVIRELQDDKKSYEGLPESTHISKVLNELDAGINSVVKLLDSNLGNTKD